MNKLTTLILVTISAFAFADAAEIKAPNGGRIIQSVTPAIEFFVTPQKKVEIRFLDGSGKVVAPGSQIITVVMGDRTKPTRLAFTKEGDKLVSDKPVAEGQSLPVVLQIRSAEGEKPVTERFNLNMAPCPECKLAEYGCTCDHDKSH